MDTSQKQNSSSTAIIIVILIIALGGAYFWYMHIKNKPEVMTQEAMNADEMTLRNDLQAQGSLDIESDLKDLDTIYEEK